MKKIIGVGFAFAIVTISCFAVCNLSRSSQKAFELNSTTKSKQTYPSQIEKYNTYVGERLGITFKYPDTWIKYGAESNAINLKGEIMAIHINFIDTISNSLLNIEYHLPPYGAELYKFSKAEFDTVQKYNEDVSEVIIAGRKAIRKVTIVRTDIKGNVVDPPLKIVSLTFLDKDLTGEFEFIFKTPLPIADTEIKKIEKLLTTIKFSGT